MRVPMADLALQHKSLEPGLSDAVATLVDQSRFIGGPPVVEFEQAFAEWGRATSCVACANGTDAIAIALHGLGIGPGDEVITSAHSWISSAEAASQVGADVRFVDVDEYFHLDVQQVEAAIGPRTAGVVGVHLFGQPFDGPALRDLAQRKGLALVEDSAQAHGATLNGEPVGSFGQAATFSFFPGKNLGAWGDAGAILTQDTDLAATMARYARHGGLSKHEHLFPGINSRLDSIQAAVLLQKLPHVAAWNARRVEIAEQYLTQLKGVQDLVLPAVRPGAQHVWHIFAVRTSRRDELAKHLSRHSIDTGIHYPQALPDTPAYKDDAGTHEFPRARENAGTMLSLPLYPELSQAQRDHVVEQVLAFFK